MKKQNILIVDDDADFRSELARQLAGGYLVEFADSVDSFQKLFQPYAFDLIVLDMRLESDRDGLRLLGDIMSADPYQLVIVVTKYVDTETHIAAIESGAQLYLNKDEFPIPFIVQMAGVILQQGHLRRRVETLEKRLEVLDSSDMVGQSPELRRIQSQVRQVSEDGEVTVLIRGESGTGKELVASNIHRLSPRRKDGPFVAVSVAGMNQSTIYSELFGHEKGAFTGALSQRKGYIEEAHGGTLFLDEIGDLDMETQVKLLRVLETRTFQRLGSTRSISADFQLVTATNQNLAERIKQGLFRKDLYYRLQAFEIWVSPLRERKKDIVPLAEHFLSMMGKAGRTSAEGFHHQVIDTFMHYDWPGNVRELRNVVEYSAIQARTHRDGLIQQEHLPITLTGNAAETHGRMELTDYRTYLAKSELELCAHALAEKKITKSELAMLLGYNDRFVFQRRMKRALEAYPAAETDFPEVVKLFM